MGGGSVLRLPGVAGDPFSSSCRLKLNAFSRPRGLFCLERSTALTRPGTRGLWRAGQSGDEVRRRRLYKQTAEKRGSWSSVASSDRMLIGSLS